MRKIFLIFVPTHLLTYKNSMRMANFTSLRNWLFMAVLCLTGTAMAQTELLQNNSFEEWNGDNPAHWVSSTTASKATLSQSAEARTGNLSVMVAGASSNQRLAYEEMTLLPGTYTFSVYAKAATSENAGARPGYAPVKADGTMGSYVYGETVSDLANTEWVQVVYEFTLSEQTTVNLVVMNPSKPGTDLLLDDASLTTSDGGIGQGGEEPEPAMAFVHTVEVESGQRYVLAALDGAVNKVAENLSESAGYGYLQVTDAASGCVIAAEERNTFLLTETEGGYTIQDSYGRYLYMTGTFNSFNVSATLPESGAVWTITFDEDSAAVIRNAETQKWIQYDSDYNSYGVYEDARGVLPRLFVANGEVPVPDPDPEVPENESSKENPYSVSEALLKYDASTPQADVWVSGYIVGYVDGMSVDGATFGAEAPEGGEVSATNLLIADSTDVTDYTQCLVIQLPAGGVREALNLQANPENLGKPVVLKGSLEKYFGTCGLKSVSEYVLDGEEPEPTPEPEPGTLAFAKATSITSGSRYVIAALDSSVNKVAQNLSESSGYGYLNVTDAAAGDNLTANENCTFTITEGDGGYLIQDAYGRYLYMTGTFNSFNVSATLPESGALWTISFDGDGLATITNVDMNKWMQYSSEYTSFGAYPDVRGILPALYVENGEAPDPEVPENESSKENPYSVGEALSKYVASTPQADVWVSGYIVGYVDGMSVDGATFGAEAPEGGEVSATNLLIADSTDVTDYTQCLVIQLPAGGVREALNLQANPENLGKPVVLKGSLEKYFGTCGLKSVSEYILDGEEPEPTPEPTLKNFAKVMSIESGRHYVIAALDGSVNKVAQNLSESADYGYLYVTDEDSSDVIAAEERNTFLLTEVEGGYTIQDSYGRYLYMTGTFNSFNVSATLPESGAVWTIDFDADGMATITNVEMGKWIQYSVEYGSYGVYPDARGVLPCLYMEKVGGTSVEGVNAEEADAPVEVYTLGGIKVGNSLDGLQKGIYILKQGNKTMKVAK